MTTTLKIAENLKLPIDAATQTFAFIARKGAGKTYTAGKLVELLLDAGVQVVVLDTVGNWYGLRLGADGKGSGFDIPVLGGLRGDIPLEAAGGALIADIVVDTGRSLILDASQFSLSDRKRFATAFGERLWLRKKGERHPAPLHLVIEESQLIVPQFTGTGGGDAARMLGVFEEIIRLGRNYGIGVSMITQRPQSVNKEVLNQTECLFVGQVNGAQERDALKKWITHQGMDVHLVDELPGLKVGTFYVWSPQWLQILEKVQVLKKKTFDASATPKVGDKRVQRDLKPLDLDDLQQQLKQTIEKAKLEDPRLLRAEVTRLNAQVKRLNEDLEKRPAGKEKRVEVPVITDAEIERLEKMATDLHERIGGQLRAAMDNFVAKAVAHVTALARFNQAAPAVTAAPARVVRPAPPPRLHPADRHLEHSNGSGGDASVGKSGLRRMLIALAQRPQGLTRGQLGLRASVSSKGGSFDTYLSRARTNGWVDTTGDRIRITDAGLLALGPYDPLPEGRALLAHYVAEFGSSGAARMLQALADVYPRAMTREELSQASNVSSSGGSFDTYLSRLRTLELVEGKNELRASEELFES